MRPGLLGEMPGSMIRARNRLEESGVSCSIEGKEVLRTPHSEGCVRDTGSKAGTISTIK